jgi:hypothetical protein
MNVSEKSADLVLIGFIVGGSEKIEIGAEDFVRTVAIKDDFRLTPFTNLTANEPVPDACPNTCNVIGFYVANNIRNNRKKLVGGYDNLGVVGANPVGDFSGVQDIGAAFKADRVGFKGRSPESLEFPLDKGGDKRGV